MYINHAEINDWFDEILTVRERVIVRVSSKCESQIAPEFGVDPGVISIVIA